MKEPATSDGHGKGRSKRPTPDLRTIRLRSQQLLGPRSTSPDEVVERILAVQAQDDRGFRLAVRSRSDGLVAEEVDRALGDRRLVVAWLNRGTLHLVRSEDYWWLHPLTAPRSASAINHRLRQLGVSRQQEDQGIDLVVASLESEGPLVRGELRARLDAEGVPTGGQALVHLLGAASLQGLVVRGPVVDGSQAFVSVRQWLGSAPQRLSRQDSLARLATRYLEGHGPATPEDLSKWAGVTLGDARVAFNEASGDVRPFGEAFVRSDSELEDSKYPPTRLLGSFDPILHGWSSREMWVCTHRSVVTTNGIFRPFILSEGRAKGIWRIPAEGIEVDLLESIDDDELAQLFEDARDVYRFLGRDVPPGVIRVNPPT
jgi:hypothetical protein